ncbi:hypothetical protein EKO04_006561 [Ascochyta lentis]|uniref:Uncharacterized protein n=1 Tax=Ascochyta lentis TaxID=205686 RepID=A0A8H7J2L8_9PLEO|nr:hypothetical protein EKO04_006561 [Ascochyta lentis]
MTYQATATDPGSTLSATVNLACSRENGKAVPTCTMTVRNSDGNIESSYCSILEDNPASTYVVTDTPRSDDGDGLLVPSAATETVANGCTGYFDSASSPDYHDYERRRDFINNYKLVITAGTEKLHAAAAATLTRNSAQSIPVLVNSTAGSSGVAQASAAAASMPLSFLFTIY